jgi:hypothetical protein
VSQRLRRSEPMQPRSTLARLDTRMRILLKLERRVEARRAAALAQNWSHIDEALATAPGVLLVGPDDSGRTALLRAFERRARFRDAPPAPYPQRLRVNPVCDADEHLARLLVRHREIELARGAREPRPVGLAGAHDGLEERGDNLLAHAEFWMESAKELLPSSQMR